MQEEAATGFLRAYPTRQKSLCRAHQPRYRTQVLLTRPDEAGVGSQNAIRTRNVFEHWEAPKARIQKRILNRSRGRNASSTLGDRERISFCATCQALPGRGSSSPPDNQKA